MEPLHDKELVDRLKNDQVRAFDLLYDKYLPDIYANTLKIVKDKIAAEDIVQEVFIALWEKRQSLRSDENVAGWLYVVSYNKSLNFLRANLKTAIKQSAYREYMEEYIEVSEGDNTVNQWRVLEEAIESLSPQKRKVFELCKLSRKSHQEVAEEMRLSKYTVKEYLYEAIISVKNHIRQNKEIPLAILLIRLFHL